MWKKTGDGGSHSPQEMMRYIIAGACTTVIGYITYCMFYEYYLASNVVSNILSWLLSVIFAYMMMLGSKLHF